MIDEAKTTRCFPLCKEELALLGTGAGQALKRKCVWRLCISVLPESKLRQIYANPIEETIYAEKVGRGIVVVRDSAEVLTGTIMDGPAWKSLSTNQVL